jgi:hypothetical protein
MNNNTELNMNNNPILNMNSNNNPLPDNNNPLPDNNNPLPDNNNYIDPLLVSDIKDEWTRKMIQDGIKTLNRLEAWYLLRNIIPEEKQGFMFNRDKNMRNVMSEIDKDNGGHSGSSIAITCRHLEFIAKNGIQQYVKEFIQ